MTLSTKISSACITAILGGIIAVGGFLYQQSLLITMGGFGLAVLGVSLLLSFLSKKT
jgi:hypothetical protein